MKKVVGYVTEKELKDVLNKLENAQDKFIVYAIYNGIAGKNNLSELTNLKVEDVDFKKHIIHVDGREVFMNPEFEKITKDTIKQKTYVNEIQSKHSIQEYELNSASAYVIKVRPRANTNNGLDPMKYEGIRSKLKSITSRTGLSATASQLETSGIINILLEQKKDWTVLEIEFENRKKNININSYRIYSIIKEINS